MRIALDMDGVLADLHRTFVDTARQLFPELDARILQPADIGASPPVDPDDPQASADAADAVPENDDAGTNVPISSRQSGAIWRELCATPDFWETLREIEDGAIARLAAIAEERAWEVLFITSRPVSAGRTVQRQSQRWLQRCGFPLPSVYVVHGSRGKVAEALNLDVVVDDRPDNCLDVVLESKARAILIWRATKASVPPSAKRLGIGVVPTVAECLDVLIEAAKPGGPVSDLRQRLRRLLGLQPK